jgi:glycogen phosphorylase
LNEGHASLLALALLEERLGDSKLGSATEADIEEVRRQCVFTTHTPVPAGHDQFPRALMTQILGADRTQVLDVTHCCPVQTLNMTYLGLRFSHYINGVAMHHGAISRDMFPEYPIRAITNGVHAVTWSVAPFQQIYDRHIPEWRHDNAYLRYAIGIPTEEIATAHKAAKAALLEAIYAATGERLNESVLTLGFARRATAYKRFNLLFKDAKRLRQITDQMVRYRLFMPGRRIRMMRRGKK